MVSVTETVTVPAGTFQNCAKVKETLSDGDIEFKMYCPGAGVAQELPEDGRVDLKSHT